MPHILEETIWEICECENHPTEIIVGSVNEIGQQIHIFLISKN